MLNHRKTTRSTTPGADAGRTGDGVEAARRRAALAGDDSRAYPRSSIITVVLTAEEERELGLLVVRENCQASRERLIRGHLQLASAIAQNYLDRGLSLQELTEAANVGLVRATESIDPTYSGRFSTCASWFIKNAIKQALSNAVHAPVFFA